MTNAEGRMKNEETVLAGGFFESRFFILHSSFFIQKI